MALGSDAAIDRQPSVHEQAHRRARRRDAREAFRIGDDLEVVIEETPAMNNGRQAVAHAGNLVVFIHPGGSDLGVGVHVEVRVTYVARNYLRAVALSRIDG